MCHIGIERRKQANFAVQQHEDTVCRFACAVQRLPFIENHLSHNITRVTCPCNIVPFRSAPPICLGSTSIAYYISNRLFNERLSLYFG